MCRSGSGQADTNHARNLDDSAQFLGIVRPIVEAVSHESDCYGTDPLSKLSSEVAPSGGWWPFKLTNLEQNPALSISTNGYLSLRSNCHPIVLTTRAADAVAGLSTKEGRWFQRLMIIFYRLTLAAVVELRRAAGLVRGDFLRGLEAPAGAQVFGYAATPLASPANRLNRGGGPAATPWGIRLQKRPRTLRPNLK